MLFSDPPIHNRLRKLVSVAFKLVKFNYRSSRSDPAGSANAMPTDTELDLIKAAAPYPLWLSPRC